MTHIDLYGEKVCRVWFYLEEFCLSLERLNLAGDMPDWLDIELMQACWDEILELPRDDDERAVWALERGIAPGQAFLMEIRPPHYFKSGPYDCQEWDCEYDTQFVRAKPMLAQEAADQWEEWIKAGYLDGQAPGGMS